MPFVSITRLRVRSWLYLPSFFIQTTRIVKQAERADGNLAIRLLPDRCSTFWTATSWASEAAMKAFMLGKPHGPAMRSLLEWCDEAAVVHWTQPGPELPDWAGAHSRLLREGRPSKVHHPSAAHTAHTLPAPDPRRSRDMK